MESSGNKWISLEMFGKFWKFIETFGDSEISVTLINNIFENMVYDSGIH